MSIITTINGIPLFDIYDEAAKWASSNGLQGAHTHIYQNQTGYIGGTSHSEAVASQGGTSTPGTNGGSSTTGGY